MKKILMFISAAVMAFCYTSCSKEEIAMYNQESRINFDQTAVYRELHDTDYVKMKDEPYRLDSVRVILQGDMLTENRDFCLKQVADDNYANSLDMQLADKYTYSNLTGVTQFAYFKVKRPDYKTGNRAYGCSLEFDLANPNHHFLKGLVERNSVTVNYVWNITEPETWGDWNDYFGIGAFGAIKYCYMMDVWGKTLDDFITEDGDSFDYDEAYDAIVQLINAYNEYKAEHGPILDENGEDIFPDEEE